MVNGHVELSYAWGLGHREWILGIRHCESINVWGIGHGKSGMANGAMRRELDMEKGNIII